MLRSLRQILALAIPAGLIVLFCGVMLCFWNRWDELVVVTLIPIWAWAAASALLSALCWFLAKNRLALFTFALWLLAGIGLSDETAGLLRDFRSALGGAGPPPADPAARLRVVTAQGAAAGIGALGELEKLKPDLILIQEAPEPENLPVMAERLYGADAGVVRSGTGAIIGRGRLSIVHDNPGTGSLVAIFERAGTGDVIDVVCLDLPPSITRTDFWNPEAWAELTERRRSNRRLLRSLLEVLPRRLGDSLQVVGGDFGAPPSDDLFRLLRNAGLADSFRRAGYGWGNTCPVSLPLLRLDQIWASAQLEPLHSEPLRSVRSERRQVVTDYRLVRNPGAVVEAGLPGLGRRGARTFLEPGIAETRLF